LSNRRPTGHDVCAGLSTSAADYVNLVRERTAEVHADAGRTCRQSGASVVASINWVFNKSVSRSTCTRDDPLSELFCFAPQSTCRPHTRVAATSRGPPYMYARTHPRRRRHWAQQKHGKR
jgi:hypothetical protein